ncbi:hypothetical protein C8255_13075 [filamentous cyanobacterium CCP3]|nr:hypothetical protein C8255_13075 [filamentous cyanobacterium CCP3]
MEELLELRELLLADRVSDALLLVEEMTEMSKDDKLNKIFSFGVILLLNLIKQVTEGRTTRSWETSILNAVKQIQRTNQRRKAGGMYLTVQELQDTLEDAYDSALRQAALEAFEGRYDAAELAQRVEQEVVIDRAIALIVGSETDPAIG